MRILGIDPGTAIVGYGVIEKKGKKWVSLDYGCIRTEPKFSPAKRLEIISQDLAVLIKKYKPNRMAVEKLFFCNNATTAMAVGQARGVILLKGQENGLSIFEYTPLQIKQALTGYGRAEKRQIQKMVKVLLDLEKIPKLDDAADALAIALCCAHRNNK